MLKKLLTALFMDKNLKDDISFLKTISLFDGLSERSLSKIAAIIYKKTYTKGESVYAPSQEANLLYIVRSGEINIECANSQKSALEGGFFGEVSLISESQKHEGKATAAKDSQLYLIYRVKFDDLIESDPRLGLKVIKNLLKTFASRVVCA
ncbi:MAG: cyclic nucleotide-binding domain-containing protein [Elusimicrobia bacterium]|nr:cyclic nucleotide-binding domain-containing protein [Elusimicrobiota bacterium]